MLLSDNSKEIFKIASELELLNKERKILKFTTIKVYNFSITYDILRMNIVGVENIF